MDHLRLLQFFQQGGLVDRPHVRHLLQQRDRLEFCEDGGLVPSAAVLHYHAHLLASLRSSSVALVSGGLWASSEDDPTQSIRACFLATPRPLLSSPQPVPPLQPPESHVRADETCTDSPSFWSSTGSRHQAGEEVLMYRLAAPLCHVRAISICIYRAEYQDGCVPALSCLLCPPPCAVVRSTAVVVWVVAMQRTFTLASMQRADLPAAAHRSGGWPLALHDAPRRAAAAVPHHRGAAGDRGASRLRHRCELCGA